MLDELSELQVFVDQVLLYVFCLGDLEEFDVKCCTNCGRRLFDDCYTISLKSGAYLSELCFYGVEFKLKTRRLLLVEQDCPVSLIDIFKQRQPLRRQTVLLLRGPIIFIIEDNAFRHAGISYHFGLGVGKQ